MTLTLTDGMAIVEIANPPQNTLSLPVREALVNDLRQALNDPAVAGVILRGANGTFCAGAEVREFGSPAAISEPLINAITDIIDASAKPVLAVIEGVALGGGLEIALGCHRRLASPSARVGLPEVKLGILPGGGGTQRAPRLIGAKAAIEIMTSGAMLSAARALEIGLIDGIVDVDPLAEGTRQLRAMITDGAKPPRVRDREAGTPEGVDPAEFFREARLAAAKAAKGAPAPAVIVDCVAASTELSFEAGLAFERARCVELLATPESQALCHNFFAERAAARIEGLPSGLSPRPVRRIGVVGAGTMGLGISLAFSAAGFETHVVDATPSALANHAARAADTLSSSVRRGRISQAEADAQAARITRSGDLQALGECDLIVEAIVEDMAAKQDVFRALAGLAKTGAILATNTSFLNVDAIAAASGERALDVLGLHFFSPAQVMRLVEVVRGKATGDEALATAMQIARRIGKTPVVSGVCDGFIGNRMLDRYFLRALDLVAAGAAPREVDAALTGFGMAMGPFTMSDLAGNDIAWHARRRKAAEHPDYRYPSFADAMCERGWFGQKSGQGWYVYAPGDRTPRDSAEFDGFLADWRREEGIAPRSFTPEEIVERCVFTLIDEGATLLAEGIAQRASDIDVVYVNGYGFPPLRGGPMFHAAQIGLPHVCARLDALAGLEPGGDWAPSAMLRKAAALGSFDLARGIAQ